MVAVAGFIAEAVWQNQSIEDLDLTDPLTMSAADWRVASVVPGSPTKLLIRAVNRIEKMFLSGSRHYWKRVTADARQLIVASRSADTMS